MTDTLAAATTHQDAVQRIASHLPPQYRRLPQVESALNASGVPPDTLYDLAVANEPTLALLRFFEALIGPSFRERRRS